MQIVAKHKKILQKVWKSHKQPNVRKRSRIHLKAKKLGASWIKTKERWSTLSPKRKKSHEMYRFPAKSTTMPNIHSPKEMHCIWWDQKGVLYCELLKLSETPYCKTG